MTRELNTCSNLSPPNIVLVICDNLFLERSTFLKSGVDANEPTAMELISLFLIDNVVNRSYAPRYDSILLILLWSRMNISTEG